MKENKRMAGDFEIIVSFPIGRKEIVIGMNENRYAARGQSFMCAYCEANDTFDLYRESAFSDDYLAIAELFSDRAAKEINTLRKELNEVDFPDKIITCDECIPDHYSQDITGKIVAIDHRILKPEYQRGTHQLYFVTGGFGAAANARGSAVFCRNLYTGESARFERADVLGEVKPDCMPEWAKEKMGSYNLTHRKQKHMER